MRILFFSISIFTVILFSCNSTDKNSGDVTIKSKNGDETSVLHGQKAEQALDEMQKQAEELQKLQPATLDEMKALVPEQIQGVERSSIQTTTAMGTGMAIGQYHLNDSTELTITIYDCGGPGGAGMFSANYLSLFNIESESETESKRTVEFDGKKGIENCSKVDKSCNLIYFAGKRYLVSLNGEGMGGGELRKIGEGMFD